MSIKSRFKKKIPENYEFALHQHFRHDSPIFFGKNKENSRVQIFKKQLNDKLVVGGQNEHYNKMLSKKWHLQRLGGLIRSISEAFSMN